MKVASLSYRSRSSDQVRKLFSVIARRYDRTNGVLSFGLHLWWNRCLARLVLREPITAALDLCSGTGATAEAILQRAPAPLSTTCVDICPEMIALAVPKLLRLSRSQGLSFVVSDVQKLPVHSASYDVATMAYGIRNVEDPVCALKEAFRCLRPGGRLILLELTRPRLAILRLLHAAYVRWLVPVLGAISGRHRQAYTYLAQSVQQFVEPQCLLSALSAAQFTELKAIPLTGGVVTLFEGRRPISST